MDKNLIEEFTRSMFRFKKVGTVFSSGLDVPMEEFFVMVRIAQDTFGSDGNMCLANIQNSLFITRPAVSQMLNSLEKKGYINREINKNDRRKIIITLTPKGQEITDIMKKHADQLISGIISGFGEDDTKKMIDLFNRFADIFEGIKSESLQGDKVC